MPKQKKTPLLYPATVKGEVQYLERKDYLSTKSKDLKREFKEVEIKPTDVSQILDMVEKGESIADDAHEVHREIFSRLQGDVTLAQEHQAAMQNEEATKKNRETLVLTAALEVDKVDRTLLDQKFVAGANFIDISPDATDEDIASKLSISLLYQDMSSWFVGDLGNALQDRGLEGVIANLCAQTNRSEATVYSNMKIAREIKKEDRNPNILPTVYKEILLPILADKPAKDAKIKAELLAEAAEKNWDSKEARSHASAARTTKPSKKGNASKGPQANFLFVKDGQVWLGTEESPTGYEEGLIQIKLKTREVLATVVKDDKEVIEWTQIETR